MRTFLAPIVLVFAAFACSRATVAVTEVDTEAKAEARTDTEGPADQATATQDEGNVPDAEPPLVPPPVAPLCKGDRGSSLAEFGKEPLYNYPRFPHAFLQALGDAPVPALDKEPATLLGVRRLETPVAVECKAPFESDGPPCRAQAVVRLALGDASIFEVLVNTPALDLEALGQNVPVRVSTHISPDFFKRFEGLTLLAADNDAPLYAIHDLRTSGFDQRGGSVSAGSLTIGSGPLTCVTTTDPCQHRFGANALRVSEGATTVEVGLADEASAAFASGTYLVRHRIAAREIPSGSPYAACGNLTPVVLSFELVRSP